MKLYLTQNLAFKIIEAMLPPGEQDIVLNSLLAHRTITVGATQIFREGPLCAILGDEDDVKRQIDLAEGQMFSGQRANSFGYPRNTFGTKDGF